MVRISIEIPDDVKLLVDRYAKERGFGKASNLARVALYSYIRKNRPTGLFKREGGTAVQAGEVLEDRTSQ